MVVMHLGGYNTTSQFGNGGKITKNNPTELKKCEYCNIATFYYQRCLINNHKKNIVK
jgi:hypothetical protein